MTRPGKQPSQHPVWDRGLWGEVIVIVIVGGVVMILQISIILQCEGHYICLFVYAIGFKSLETFYLYKKDYREFFFYQLFQRTYFYRTKTAQMFINNP